MDQDRNRKLIAYLNDCARRGAIPQGMAARAWWIWSQIAASMSFVVPVPNASPGGEQQILYSWDRDNHHLECEVFPDGRVEWFYRDRATGALWDLDATDSYPVPPEAQERLLLLAAGPARAGMEEEEQK
jgi:hypothetical protein